MIVIGYNHFHMRTYTPQQVGLPESYNGYNVEVRQKYFHLMYIPTFPLGQLWGLRKSADGQLYVIPEAVKKHVEKQVKVPAVSPWAFSGLYVAFVIMLMVMAN